eukprot:SM000119S25659  [mRNA]  locus=s119:273094:276143:- [translate_table: standard]
MRLRVLHSGSRRMPASLSSGRASSATGCSAGRSRNRISPGKRPYIAYHAEDDEAIEAFVRDAGAAGSSVTGTLLWKAAEEAAVTRHSWQSMKDRFLKHILPAMRDGAATTHGKAGASISGGGGAAASGKRGARQLPPRLQQQAPAKRPRPSTEDGSDGSGAASLGDATAMQTTTLMDSSAAGVPAMGDQALTDTKDAADVELAAPVIEAPGEVAEAVAASQAPELLREGTNVSHGEEAMNVDTPVDSPGDSADPAGTDGFPMEPGPGAEHLLLLAPQTQAPEPDHGLLIEANHLQTQDEVAQAASTDHETGEACQALHEGHFEGTDPPPAAAVFSAEARGNLPLASTTGVGGVPQEDAACRPDGQRPVDADCQPPVNMEACQEAEAGAAPLPTSGACAQPGLPPDMEHLEEGGGDQEAEDQAGGGAPGRADAALEEEHIGHVKARVMALAAEARVAQDDVLKALFACSGSFKEALKQLKRFKARGAAITSTWTKQDDELLLQLERQGGTQDLAPALASLGIRHGEQERQQRLTFLTGGIRL